MWRKTNFRRETLAWKCVSKETLEMWLADFEDIEDKLKYHYENREYKLPYELALGNVKL